MGRLIRYIVLIGCSLLWMVGCLPDLRREAYQIGIFKDDFRYGDLYRLSNLAQFKAVNPPCAKLRAANNPSQRVGLYIIGDSFTESQRMNQDDFAAQKYVRIHWNDSLKIQLDTSLRNVLVLETVERHFREHFVAPIRNLSLGAASPRVIAENTSSDWVERWEKILQNSEESLISTLLSYDWAFKLREWKAALNLRWFGRHDEQVEISPDGKHLLFNWDTDSTRITSSFKSLSDAEVNILVTQANQAREFYRKLGFDEVYLAIIPNKTSIVAPAMGPYNHLVERVQNHPQLNVPLVDVWQVYAQRPTEIYSLSDTHWNCTGQQLWLDQVNEKLKPR